MSQRYAWSEQYALGVEKIDEQHRQIIAQFNDLTTALTQHFEPKAIKQRLEKLTNTCDVHFSYEESKQKACSYPDYHQHKAIHDNFICMISKLTIRSMTAPNDLHPRHVESIFNQILSHMINEDAKFAIHLQKHVA